MNVHSSSKKPSREECQPHGGVREDEAQGPGVGEAWVSQCRGQEPTWTRDERSAQATPRLWRCRCLPPDLGADLSPGCCERAEWPRPAGTRESAFVQAFLLWPVLKSRKQGLCWGLRGKIRERRRTFHCLLALRSFKPSSGKGRVLLPLNQAHAGHLRSLDRRSLHVCVCVWSGEAVLISSVLPPHPSQEPGPEGVLSKGIRASGLAQGWKQNHTEL